MELHEGGGERFRIATQLNGDCLAYIKSTRLEKLSVVGTGETSFSLAHVARFENLSKLKVWHVHVSE